MKLFFRLLQLLFIIAAIGILVYAGYRYTSVHQELTQNIPFLPKACSAPLVYTVGEFDTGFGISKDEFVSALGEAAGLWNTAAGKTVLSYGTEASATSVPVNLI
jgi:hypothetical protein